MTLQSGKLLQNRYRILQQIGGGGMGVVYLAEDTRLPGRQCAIKEISPAQLAPQDRNWAIQAFKQEAQMLARLSHPGLTAVTDFFPEDGNWYLVMEYIVGETLEARLRRAPGERLPLAEALNIVRQLCNVLEYLHSQTPPVVFRDLKPGNVMLTPQGEVKLIDFGIARFFKPGQTRDTVNLGTPGYAAPEQYGGAGQSDPRTDIYSLGVLLLQLATGYDPTTAVTPFPLPSPANLIPRLPPHIETAIVHATQMHPDRRYRNIQELRQGLFPPTMALPSGVWTPQPYGQPPPQTQLVPAGNRGIWIWISAVLVGVLLIGLCVAAASGSDRLLALIKPPEAVTTPTRTSVPRNTPFATALPTLWPGAPTATRGNPTMPTTSVATLPSTGSELPATPLFLAYVHGSVGNTDVYVMRVDSGERTCVACAPCDEAEPAWSPDGRYVTYQANCGNSYDIWIVSSGGDGAPNQLTHTSDVDEREPDWSPDGSQIIFRANVAGQNRNADGDLRVMDADGSGVYSLGIQGRSPTWSPDGRRIVFMSERDGSWQIYVYTFSSGITSRLTACGVNCRWPAWSPDGQYVVYHSTTGPSTTDADTIWCVLASGGTPTQVTSGYHAGRPTWSALGLIAFNSDRGIEVIRVDGSERRTLVSGDQNWAPVWSR